MDSGFDGPDLYGGQFHHEALPQGSAAGAGRPPLEPRGQRCTGALKVEADRGRGQLDLQCGATAHLSGRGVRAFSSLPLDRPGDVVRDNVGVPGIGDSAGWSSVGSNTSLRLCCSAAAFYDGPHPDDLSCRILAQCAGDDNGICAARGEDSMSKILGRRSFLTAGLATAAGASGLGAAVYLANRYGLIPPDHGGIVGIGETLTYASQRLIISGYSLAREFKRSDISKIPTVNGWHPTDEKYLALLADGFKNWRLSLANC